MKSSPEFEKWWKEKGKNSTRNYKKLAREAWLACQLPTPLKGRGLAFHL